MSPLPLARREEGQTVVVFAITILALLFMVGLAVDVGILFVAHRTAQEAADAGAYGGALVLYQNGSTVDARDAAVADIQRNGFVDGADEGRTRVFVNLPPTSGPHAADSRYVEVIIEAQVRTLLVPGQGTLNSVVVRGVGGTAPAGLAYALMVLNSNENAALKISGQGSLSVTGAGIQVNSSSCPAVQVSGSGSILAPSTEVVGCVQQSGSGTVTPPATIGVQSDPDPFAGLAGPSTTGLPVYGPTSIGDDGTYTLQPGVYSEGIQFSGNGIVYLMPGVYILKEKGLQVSGNGELRVHGSAAPEQGVLLYNTIKGYPASTPDSCDKIQFSGNGVIELRASSLSSDPWKGMLIFQDRRCTKEMQISGNGGFHDVTGTIYLPQAPLQISGNGTFDANYHTQIIAQTVVNSGDATIHLHYDANENAQGILPALVE
jgi:hypothetical protein